MKKKTYQAAPTTLRPMQSAIPVTAQAYGEVVERNSPMLKLSPAPVKSWSVMSLENKSSCQKKKYLQRPTTSSPETAKPPTDV